jgi:cell division septal protein FtsQ
MKKKKQGYRKSFRTKKRKSILRSRVFWIVLLTALASAGLFYLLFISSVFQIKEIKISGNNKVSSEEIREIVEKNSERKVVFFSSKSIFFNGFSESKKEIKNSFPLVAEVEISRRLPGLLEVSIKERLAVATWRFEEESLFLDKEGVVFEKSEEVKKPVIRGGQRVSLGESAIKSTLLEDILEINNRLEREEVEIREFLVSYPKICVKTQKGWEVYFDAEGNIATQTANLVLALKEEIPQSERDRLEYIDLRFKERIFYKFRET